MRITVRVFGYAQVSRGTLAEAEKEAGKIFREAGVETVWLDCVLSGAVVGIYPACHEVLGPADLVLRIQPRFEVVKGAFRDTTLGFALASEGGGWATYATVFYDRVEEESAEGIASLSQVLGHGIAHEIGHLLLGPNAHSQTGIMRARWDREDLRLAAQARSRFTSQQADLIRSRVQARMRDQRAP